MHLVAVQIVEAGPVGQRDDAERPESGRGGQPQYVGEEARTGVLVASRDDGVVNATDMRRWCDLDPGSRQAFSP